MTTRDILSALMKRKIGRNNKPVTPNQVAQGAGVPQSTISRILSGGSTDVRTRILEQLAKYFGVTVAQMRGDAPLDDAPAEPRERQVERRSGNGGAPAAPVERVHSPSGGTGTATVAHRATMDLLNAFWLAETEEEENEIAALIEELQSKIDAANRAKRRR